jgi:hypothetical protein
MQQRHDQSAELLDELMALRVAQRVIGEHVLALLSGLPQYKRRVRPGRLTQHVFAMTLVSLLSASLKQTPNGEAGVTALRAAVGHILPPDPPFDDRMRNRDLDDEFPF